MPFLLALETCLRDAGVPWMGARDALSSPRLALTAIIRFFRTILIMMMVAREHSDNENAVVNK
jgi:hypothetical protein